MSNKLIVACYIRSRIELLGGNFVIGDSLATKLVWRCHQPTVLIQEQLMHAHLMSFRGVIETSVVNQQSTSLMIYNSRVVTLRQLCCRHCFPLIVAKEFHTLVALGICAVVEDILVVHGIDTCRCQAVLVRTVRIGRAEHTHLVTTSSRQASITHEEIIILAHLLDVAGLTRHIIAAGYLLAEIRVTSGVGIGRTCGGRLAAYLVREGIGIVAKTIFRVQTNHENTARP